MITGLIHAISGILFPKLCVGCKKPGILLCDKCWLKVQFLYEQTCPVCQHPSIAGLAHPSCRTPWSMDALTSIAYYRGPIRPLIRQLKYGGATVLKELIEQLFNYYIQHQDLHLKPGIITTIPISKQARYKRGFNQADIIAKVVAQHTGYPFIPDILSRNHQKSSQTKLSKEQRQENLRGAFSLNKEIGMQLTKSEMAKTSFIIVDDVFTTGTTLKEAAKVLKRAGAVKVHGFTLAQD